MLHPQTCWCLPVIRLLGWEKLFLYCQKEWSDDIVSKQLPGIIGGLGPLNAILQVFGGIRDLFVMPVEQYRKDGRIMRGLQRGTHSFMTSTAMSTLELTNRIVQTLQVRARVYVCVTS